MSNLTSFKEFVKKNPSLVKYVNNNEMTWQKFYELFDLYGENNDIWNKYVTNKTEISKDIATVGIGDLVQWFKNIDLDSIQNNINNIQRVMGVLQDLGKNEDIKTDTYKPRPIYKHFED